MIFEFRDRQGRARRAALSHAALATAAWCALHSVFVSHAWQRLVECNLPSFRPWQRLVYVGASTASFGLLALWLRTLPETVLWDWTGAWR